MKEFTQRALVTAAAVAAIVSLGLGATTAVNTVATAAERNLIEPYGSPSRSTGGR